VQGTKPTREIPRVRGDNPRGGGSLGSSVPIKEKGKKGSSCGTKKSVKTFVNRLDDFKKPARHSRFRRGGNQQSLEIKKIPVVEGI